MGNVVPLTTPRDDVASLLDTINAEHESKELDYFLAFSIDSDGKLRVYRMGCAAPAEMTHLLGVTLTRLYADSMGDYLEQYPGDGAG